MFSIRLTLTIVYGSSTLVYQDGALSWLGACVPTEPSYLANNAPMRHTLPSHGPTSHARSVPPCNFGRELSLQQGNGERDLGGRRGIRFRFVAGHRAWTLRGVRVLNLMNPKDATHPDPLCTVPTRRLTALAHCPHPRPSSTALVFCPRPGTGSPRRAASAGYELPCNLAQATRLTALACLPWRYGVGCLVILGSCLPC